MLIRLRRMLDTERGRNENDKINVFTIFIILNTRIERKRILTEGG